MRPAQQPTGLTAIIALHLIQSVSATHQVSDDILERFPKVFTRLKTLHHQVNEDTNLFALCTPKRVVHFSLHNQVQDDDGSDLNGDNLNLNIKKLKLICHHDKDT